MLQIHVRSAVAGVLAVGLVVFALGAAQIRVNPPPAAVSPRTNVQFVAPWVHPRDFVRITSTSPFVVPDGKWFALTALGKPSSGSGGRTQLFVDGTDVGFSSEGRLFGAMTGTGDGPASCPVLPPGVSFPAGLQLTVTGGEAWGYLVDA